MSRHYVTLTGHIQVSFFKKYNSYQLGSPCITDNQARSLWKQGVVYLWIARL